VQLVFDKFDELGSCSPTAIWSERIRLGVRSTWTPPRPLNGAGRPGTVSRMLHHPSMRGYSYGRRRVDHKRTAASGGKLKCAVPMSEWMVLERDRLPASSRGNGTRPTSRVAPEQMRPVLPGAPHRQGLLTGLLAAGPVAGACASYRSVDRLLRVCAEEDEGSTCSGLEARVVDDLVAQQVLQALGRRPGVEPGHRGCAPRAASAASPLETRRSGPPARPNAPNGSTRRRARGSSRGSQLGRQ
jgi:hypothetical protein